MTVYYVVKQKGGQKTPVSAARGPSFTEVVQRLEKTLLPAFGGELLVSWNKDSPLLRQNGEISTLKEEFPQDSRVIWVLQKVLSLGAIKPEGLSGIHWNSDNGHGIHIVISI